MMTVYEQDLMEDFQRRIDNANDRIEDLEFEKANLEDKLQGCREERDHLKAHNEELKNLNRILQSELDDCERAKRYHQRKAIKLEEGFKTLVKTLEETFRTMETYMGTVLNGEDSEEELGDE